MTDPVHKREQRWEDSPFSSFEQIVGLIEEMATVEQEAGAQIGIPNVAVDLEKLEYGAVPLSEFRELIPALAFGDAKDIWATIPSIAQSESVSLRFRVWNTEYEVSTTLWVDGRPEAVVNGILKAATDRIEALFEAKRHAEELEAAAVFKAEEAARAAAAPPPPPPESRLKKFAYNPYTLIGATVLFSSAASFVVGLVVGSH